jgi:hypothetical protein
MKSVLIIVTLILLSRSAAADCQTVSSDERKCYDNLNAPAAMVYKQLVFIIFVESLNCLDDLDSLGDEKYHAGRYFVEAGITPKMSSADVVRYFVERFLVIDKEVHETQRRMLCVDGKPRYKGAENFLIFNQMDEVALNIYEKHYFLTRADLQASGLFDLEEALMEYPASFTEVFLDHEKARNGSIDWIYKDASKICEKPYERRFSTTVSESEEHPKIQ